MAASKKHTMNDNEDFVNVVFPGLVKKNKADNKFEINSVEVNNQIYHFSGFNLNCIEPKNTLLNPHTNELKKKIDNTSFVLKYLEPIENFSLIIDYINGYSIENFEDIFQQNFKKLDEFLCILIKLGFNNLKHKLQQMYPLLIINGKCFVISKKLINTLEPNNSLFLEDRKINQNTFSHFRDKIIFEEYLINYIRGTQTLQETINKIKNLSTKIEGKYTTLKIKDDLVYFKLYNLLSHIDKC
jgi:hypothetical protein